MAATAAARSESRSSGLGAFNHAFDAFVTALRRARARTIEGDGLTLSQYELLRALLDAGRLPVGQLAERASVAGPTATQILDGLERGGLVERTRSTSDRRTVSVSLTDRGRRQVAGKRRAIVERRRRLFESLTIDERHQAAQLLHHLAELMGEL
jgi:DNA-binding MarR family transcriptional regulator